MGTTIHWQTIKQARIEQRITDSILSLIKNMATEIGYQFVEHQELGYMCSIKTDNMIQNIKSENTDFVGLNDHSNWNPQRRMMAIRSGKPLVIKHSMMVHPTNTESFCIDFVQNLSDYIMIRGNCKTQAFRTEDPQVNMRSHMWIIATLMSIKSLVPELEIIDETGFYEPDKDFLDLNPEKILESFGENLSIIERVKDELKEAGYGDSKIGTELKTELIPDERIVSTGVNPQNNEYIYTMYENQKVICQQILETQKKLVVRVEIKEEQEHENNRSP